MGGRDTGFWKRSCVLRRDAKPCFATACKPRFSAANYKDVLNDQRAIDRSVSNYQIGSHQDFGGVRGEVFFAYLRGPGAIAVS